jgi:Mrp family chromosome partitioning ATPase
VLSSALPKDGKTTCSVALARQSALSGFKTVLLDCDLRRRSASAELNDRPAAGLLEVIYGQATLEQALYLDGFTRLSFLPVSTNMHLVRKAVVQDVVSGPLMADLVSALRRRFDRIFIDTPPLLAVADTRHLAPLADALLFVTRWKKTPRDAAAEAVAVLKSAGAPLAGVVLTQASRHAVARRRTQEALRLPALARRVA